MYLFFAIIVCLLTFAFIIDTFNLGLTEALYNLVLLLPLIGFFFVCTRKPVAAVILSYTGK